MVNALDADARLVLSDAVDMAQNLQHLEVDPAHLLAALAVTLDLGLDDHLTERLDALSCGPGRPRLSAQTQEVLRLAGMLGPGPPCLSDLLEALRHLDPATRDR